MLTDKEIENLQGLSQNQAETILKNEGFNELPSEKSKKIWQIILGVLKEPMLLLLVACSLIYFTLSDIREAIILCFSIFAVVVITIHQENKTEKALSALRQLASPRALVIRDGLKKIIAGREVVKGDYVFLNEGDRVSADGLVLWTLNLFIDESVLTGESIAVQKSAGNANLEVGRPASGPSPFAYSGTLVTSGQGIMSVKKTGGETEMGKIGKMLDIIKEENTPLQKEVGKIIKTVSLIGLMLCLTVVILYIFRIGGLIDGLLAGLTLAMSILPEELPVMMVIFLSLGAWRISKRQVLARNLNAVETLGSTSVLCVDKTGTLTQNKMRVEKIFALAKRQPEFSDISFYPVEKNSDLKNLPLLIKNVGEFAYLSCKKNTFDPMDTAIKEFCAKGLDTEDFEKTYEFLREYPLSHKLLAVANVWRKKNGSIAIAAKGAPEAVAELCHMTKQQTEKLMSAVKTMALDNLRILGVAQAKLGHDNLPEKMHDFNFEFLGLLGLADPVRTTVPSAIAECYGAGIKIIMITGDYPETAKNIAKQIGLKNPGETITGEEFDMMSDDELLNRLKTVTVFSRMVPTQKLRIVEALKENGEIVAMTGDGVNDAPALKSAHIGIAMGKRGTDVSREASDIVLLNDSFASLISGIKAGRTIFDNLRKAVAYILSIHIPIAGLALLPIMLEWPLVLYPVHVVFLEFIIDPACSVLFEAEPAEKNVMKRPPANQNSRF
jgi:P-type Ca2+ transporter type 2C